MCGEAGEAVGMGLAGPHPGARAGCEDPRSASILVPTATRGPTEGPREPRGRQVLLGRLPPHGLEGRVSCSEEAQALLAGDPPQAAGRHQPTVTGGGGSRPEAGRKPRPAEPPSSHPRGPHPPGAQRGLRPVRGAAGHAGPVSAARPLGARPSRPAGPGSVYLDFLNLTARISLIHLKLTKRRVFTLRPPTRVTQSRPSAVFTRRERSCGPGSSRLPRTRVSKREPGGGAPTERGDGLRARGVPEPWEWPPRVWARRGAGRGPPV